MERMNKGDLLHIGTAYVEVHTFKGKDYVTVRDFNTTTNALSKEILELEEENKTLKDNVEFLHSCLDDRDKSIAIMQEENKKLKSDLSECECSMHFENDEVGYRKRECKKLKEKVETLELWLDNKEKLNEEYRKQIDKYKRQYEHSMGGDDELIYEEGLYD